MDGDDAAGRDGGLMMGDMMECASRVAILADSSRFAEPLVAQKEEDDQ